jgi:hypothetical protein
VIGDSPDGVGPPFQVANDTAEVRVKGVSDLVVREEGRSILRREDDVRKQQV